MSNDFWAGYLSGAASIVIGNPLDLVKVRLQASSPDGSAAASPRTWTSARTLAAGLPAPILTYGALNALLFTTYNRALCHLPGQISQGNALEATQHPLASHFVAGAAAGFATFFISTPTEYVKCRAQLAGPSSPTRSHSSSSSFTIASQTWRERGFRGLFLGGTVTSLRDAVGYGFWFATYEGSGQLWDRYCGENVHPGLSDSSNSALKILLCGGLAGVATWTSIFPLDVIKTRVQTQRLEPVHPQAMTTSSSPLLAKEKVRTRGALAMAREAYRHEGLAVFWRGLGVCCLRAFIVNAVQWSVYEWAVASLSR